MATDGLVNATAIHHIRLTVTDIHRSKAFYQTLVGGEPAFDFSDKVDEPGVKEDQEQLYGGAGFMIGDQLLGLRPVADATDAFQSTRVGLDHISFLLNSAEELRAAGARLDDAGIKHGEILELPGFDIAVLSLQDPDDINLELTAPLSG